MGILSEGGTDPITAPQVAGSLVKAPVLPHEPTACSRGSKWVLSIVCAVLLTCVVMQKDTINVMLDPINATANFTEPTLAPLPPPPPETDAPIVQSPPPLPSHPPQRILNNNTRCIIVVDGLTNTTWPPRSQEILDECGGPVTNRPKEMRHLPDPMLTCHDYTSAVYTGAFFWYGGYYPEQPVIERKAVERLGQPILNLFSDYGCYTAGRGPANMTIGEHGGYFIGVTPKYRIVDMASVWLMRRYHASDIDVNADAYYGQAMEVVRAAQSAAVGALKLRYIPGDVVLLPTMYENHFLGQQLQEFILALARAYTSGILSKPNVTIVVYRASDGTDHAMRAWMEPLLAADNVTVVWLHGNEMVQAERPWFVPMATVEMTETCVTAFVTAYVLPRALKAVRADRAFPWGNDTLRSDPKVSDVEWARTLPKKIAIIKQNHHARHQRGFSISGEDRNFLKRIGFEWVEDNSPFLWRVALISYAEVMLTTFGAMQAINSRMWGGYPGLRADFPDGTRPPLRMIGIMHPGYHNEQDWWVPWPCRIGEQNGTRVLVSQIAGLGATHMWIKSVRAGGEFSALTEQILTFEAKDCTLDTSKATDFRSTWAVRDPNGNPQKRSGTLNSTWHLIPKYGTRCPQPRDA
jgi:hypothetical protein